MPAKMFAILFSVGHPMHSSLSTPTQHSGKSWRLSLDNLSGWFRETSGYSFTHRVILESPVQS